MKDTNDEPDYTFEDDVADADLLDTATKDKIAKIATLFAEADVEMKRLTPPKRSVYFDEDGQPIDMMTWVKNDRRGRFRVQDYTANGYVVSTVYLGLDHRMGLAGPPLIYETMVFRRWPKRWAPRDHEQQSVLFSSELSRINYSEQAMRRYATKAEALAGHHDLLAEVRTWTPASKRTSRRRELRKVRNSARFWREAQQRQAEGRPLFDFMKPLAPPAPTADDRPA